jgi:hypothetical protein
MRIAFVVREYYLPPSLSNQLAMKHRIFRAKPAVSSHPAMIRPALLLLASSRVADVVYRPN